MAALVVPNTETGAQLAAGDRGRPSQAPVTTARAGLDEAAFAALFERTAPALRGYLARVSGSRTLADDLLQEAYLRLLRSGFVGSSDDHTRSYLFRIATNLLRDHYRRRRHDTAELADQATSPAEAAPLELRHDFGAVFAALPARERAMLWLAYVEGSSHREIAAALRVKAGSIKVMLSRARSRLATLLRERGLAPDARTEGER